MKILIFGASGFLGTKLYNFFKDNHEVLGTCQKKVGDKLVSLDANNSEEIEKLIFSFSPNLTINVMGITNSFECEKNPEIAEKINFYAAKKISDISRKIGAKQVFISSSYVFDGERGDYVEEDTPNPQTKYGQMKLKAEKAVLSNDGLVIRVEVMYGYNGKDMPNGVVGKVIKNKLLEERNPNQKRSPLFMDDVGPAIFSLVSRNYYGLFHLAGPDKMSMYSLLTSLKDATGSPVEIIKLNDPNALVKTPQNATLSSKKIINLGIEITSFQKGISILKQQVSKQL